MDTFDDILKYYNNLFVSKGYDDHSMNAFGGIDPFIRRLEQNIAHAISPDGRIFNQEEFTVPLKGFFNEDADVVDYRFGFALDYVGIPQIRFVQATMAGERIRLPLTAPDLLPGPLSIYDMLNKGHLLSRNTDDLLEKRIPLMVPYARARIDALCDRQGNILLKRGYLSDHRNDLFDRKRFSEALLSKVLRTVAITPNYLGLFVLNSPKPEPYDRYTMSYRMAFEFDIHAPSLNVVGLQAQLGQDKLLVFPKETSLLPSVEKVYNRLSKQNIITNAREVYNKITDSMPRGPYKGLATGS